jgi:hypothetical protein
MTETTTSPFPDDAAGGMIGRPFSRGDADPRPAPEPPAASIDPSAALFAVMRSTFWSTGEEFLQRLVSSLGVVLDHKVVLAERVTARDEHPEGALGLWIAEGADAFRYSVILTPGLPAQADEAVVAAVSRALEWDGALRGIPLRSPSGRPLGQLLLSGASTGGRFGVTLLDAVLLSPLAARAGAELARLESAPSRTTGAHLIYMCAWCKGVRDPRHAWHSVETYIRTLTDAAFTHGICPDCSKERV